MMNGTRNFFLLLKAKERWALAFCAQQNKAKLNAAKSTSGNRLKRLAVV